MYAFLFLSGILLLIEESEHNLLDLCRLDHSSSMVM